MLEDETKGQKQSTSIESDVGQYAYDSEPLANAEWLAIYEEEEKKRKEKEEDLVERLTGLKLVESW